MKLKFRTENNILFFAINNPEQAARFFDKLKTEESIDISKNIAKDPLKRAYRIISDFVLELPGGVTLYFWEKSYVVVED